MSVLGSWYHPGCKTNLTSRLRGRGMTRFTGPSINAMAEQDDKPDRKFYWTDSSDQGEWTDLNAESLEAALRELSQSPDEVVCRACGSPTFRDNGRFVYRNWADCEGGR